MVLALRIGSFNVPLRLTKEKKLVLEGLWGIILPTYVDYIIYDRPKGSFLKNQYNRK